MDEVQAKDSKRLQRIMVMICLTALVLVLAGLNRKVPLTILRTPMLGILRLCDLNTIFILAPISIAIMWGLFQLNKGTESRWLTQLMVLGVFLLGLGFGIHEPFNAMHGQIAMSAELRKVVLFLDDGLSHWVFFAGFVATSIAITAAEIRHPYERLQLTQLIIPLFAGICAAGVVYFNMVWEDTIVDLMVMLATAGTVLVMQWVGGVWDLRRLPLVFCLYLMYGVGPLVTLAHWGLKAVLN